MDANQMPMHAQMLSAPPAGGLPSTEPTMYMQILAQAQQEWAMEDAAIQRKREAALWQAVMSVAAPVEPENPAENTAEGGIEEGM